MPAPTATAMASSQSNPFIKHLGSSDRTTRDRAVSSLRIYLRRDTTFTSLDCLKLWKGLFYCMFMCDKPRNQQRLARDFATLVQELRSRENVLGFLQAFWKTMAREWSGIDSLRMDKFLYLVRCYVRAGFEVCAAKTEKGGLKWSEYQRILRGEGGPLSSRDVKVPNGLRLHVLDVWVDELQGVEIGEIEKSAEEVMAPIQKLGEESFVKSVRERAMSVWNDPRWRDREVKATEDNEENLLENGQDDADEKFEGFDG